MRHLTDITKRFSPSTCVLLICLLLGSSIPLSYGAEPPVQENQLKAVYIYNFLHFVTWPTACELLGDKKPKIIGIIGSSPVGQALEELGQRLSQTNKRPIKVKHYNASDDITNCQLLFFSPKEAAQFQDIRTNIKAPTLTIADTEDFLDKGGMITMVTITNKMRYKINQTAAKAAGLRLNAQLLRSAIEVR